MKIAQLPFGKTRLILLTILTVALSSAYRYVYCHPDEDTTVPVSITGVHHLGSDYFIRKFYINKSIGDNIDKGGGGGSNVCCLILPFKWSPHLIADVRWKVGHIIRSANPATPETAELEGIYRAQVPVEKYSELGNLYVHFFPDGRVRIVVSPNTSDSEVHPIRSSDTNASRAATFGKKESTLFTAEELSELRDKADSARLEHGGWR